MAIERLLLPPAFKRCTCAKSFETTAIQISTSLARNNCTPDEIEDNVQEAVRRWPMAGGRYGLLKCEAVGPDQCKPCFGSDGHLTPVDATIGGVPDWACKTEC